jgi:hypothetical protein
VHARATSCVCVADGAWGTARRDGRGGHGEAVGREHAVGHSLQLYTRGIFRIFVSHTRTWSQRAHVGVCVRVRVSRARSPTAPSASSTWTCSAPRTLVPRVAVSSCCRMPTTARSAIAPDTARDRRSRNLVGRRAGGGRYMQALHTTCSVHVHRAVKHFPARLGLYRKAVTLRRRRP